MGVLGDDADGLAERAWVSWRTSQPSIFTTPVVTSYSRGTSEAIVVLPAPDGPTKATICPGSICNETSWSTSTSSVDGSSPSGRGASSEAIETSDAGG